MRLGKFLLTEGINDKGIFKAVFMAGHPGAGKTFTLSKIKSGQVEPRWVNTDRLYIEKDRIDKLAADSKFREFAENWNDGWVNIRGDVKRISRNQLALYINSVLPLAVDGTSNNRPVTIRRKGLLESYGYDTAMVFVKTSLETAIERASERGKSMGRKVDPDFIKKAYDEIEDSKSYYRNKFDDWQEISNDEGELTEKVIKNAFLHMSGFYNGPLHNPDGIKMRDGMLKNGWKYLSPNIRNLDDIKRVVDVWYERI
jgi:hypothetical protein